MDDLVPRLHKNIMHRQSNDPPPSSQSRECNNKEKEKIDDKYSKINTSIIEH